MNIDTNNIYGENTGSIEIVAVSIPLKKDDKEVTAEVTVTFSTDNNTGHTETTSELINFFELKDKINFDFNRVKELEELAEEFAKEM